MVQPTVEEYPAKAMGPWSLRGRDEELRMIRSLLERRSGGGLIFSGGVGLGKTRLAQEALKYAQEHHRDAYFMHTTDAPLLTPESLMAAFGHIFADPAGPACESAARREPLPVFIVEDLHLLSAPVAEVIHRRILTSRMVLVGTARPATAVPAAVSQLWSSSLSRRIDLAPLSRTDSERLVVAALGARIEGATFARIWALAKGIPLYLREIVAAGLIQGRLCERRGLWCWNGDMVPSQRLVELVEQDVALLTPDQRRTLEVVSFAQGGSLAELARAGALEADLEVLERQEFIRVEVSARRVAISITNPLVAWVMRHAMREIASRRLAHDMAQVRSSYPARRSGDRRRLAKLRLRSGQDLSVDVAIAGAQEALELMDFTGAESLARHAEYLGAGVMARLILIEALMGLGRVYEVEELCNMSPEELGLAEFSTGVLRALNLWWGLGQRQKAKEVLDALAVGSNDPLSRSVLQSVQARMSLEQGDFVGGAQLGAEVLAANAAPQAVASARSPVLLSRAAQGALLEGAELAAICPPSELPGIHQGRWEASFMKEELAGSFAGALLLMARVEESRCVVDAGLDRAAALRRPFLLAAWTMLSGMVANVEGRLKVARTQLIRAREYLRDSGPEGLHHQVLSRMAVRVLALVLVQMAEYEEAEEVIREAEEQESRGWIERWTPDARIWILANSGRTAEAQRMALGRAAELRQNGALLLEALTHSQLARMGMASVVVDRMEELAREVPNPLADELARFARGACDNDGAALEVLARGWRERGLLLLALEAYGLADKAYREQGATASAHQVRAQCEELLQACEGAETPIVQALRQDTVLTARQFEIAQMAAGGMSSRAIAQKLVISVRTVDNTLGQIYRKLGIRKRSDLAQAFVDMIATQGHPDSA